MDSVILNKIYQNDIYLNYLRYNPKWYIPLNQNPANFANFENEIKRNLKITTMDKIDNFKKQIDFINGMLKYLKN